MRILVLSNLPPYVLGGAENQVARLVESWTNWGHDVEVAGHRLPSGVLRLGKAIIRTHRIVVLERFGRAGRALSYLFSLACLVHSIGNRFDVIYCRGLGDGAISICLLKALMRVRLPLLSCPINARGAGDAHFIRSIPGWRRLVSLINRHCDAINVIAPAILSDLVTLGIDSPRISCIPNGIPIGASPARSAVSPIRRMVWVGRLSPQKGLDQLLRALAKVAALGREFSLEIIGDGPERDSLIQLRSRLGLNSRIHFSGVLASHEIRDKLAKDADVFVLPSRYEGMSNAAMEAMEAGLPVLMTRCGGIDTYVDADTGWLCDPDDLDGLTSAILRMLDTPDSQLLSMGRRARLLVERHFDIDSIARRNAFLMQQLAVPGGMRIENGNPREPRGGDPDERGNRIGTHAFCRFSGLRAVGSPWHLCSSTNPSISSELIHDSAGST